MKLWESGGSFSLSLRTEPAPESGRGAGSYFIKHWNKNRSQSV